MTSHWLPRFVPGIGRRADRCSREAAEACLAHAVGGAAELAYKRTDFLEKRRAPMEAWATFCR